MTNNPDLTNQAGADQEGVLTPDGMLQLVRDQQRQVEQRQLAPVIWLLVSWGVAWFVGFLMLWSAWPGGNPWFQVPGLVAGVTFGVLIAAAIAASVILGVRIGRGVKGQSTFAGAVYGSSWSISGAAFALVGVGLMQNGMSTELASLYFPSAFALMAGVLYLAGAALWRNVGQLVLGIAILVVASIAPFFGQPTNNLVMALGGGGAFLIAAIATAVSLKSGR
jgi:hypothetical protein